MDPRKIKDEYHLCLQQLLKTQVILILNFTRPNAITYTDHNSSLIGHQQP